MGGGWRKVLIASLVAAAFLPRLAAQTFLVEAEDFQFGADWERTDFRALFGLNSKAGSGMPLTAMELAEGGEFFVWANSMDFPDNAPRTRTYNVLIDGSALEKPAGMHGREGVWWEKLGSLKLEKGEHLLQLKGIGAFVRCDAIILTTAAAFDPNAGFDRNKIRVKPKTIEYEYVREADLAPPQGEYAGEVLSIKNTECSIIFSAKKDADGKMFYERGAEIFSGGKRVKLHPFKDEVLFSLYQEKCQLNDGSYFAAWDKSTAKALAKVAGKEVELELSSIDPYAAGHSKLHRLAAVKKIDERTFALEFEGGISGRLALPEKGFYARFDVEAAAPQDGFYSFGFAAFNALKEEDVSAAFLPTIYQGRRMMRELKMVTDSITSQPLCIFEYEQDGTQIVSGICANPERLPFEWSGFRRSRYGFCMLNPGKLPQTASFCPVLGAVDSFKKKGEKISASWSIVCMPGDWRDALSAINAEIFAGARLRETFETSFSDAICNIREYLKRGEHSGWSSRHKARWNIEVEDIATLAHPLGEVSAAILADDEEYYQKIALPSIEFTLSRNSAHFSTIVPGDHGYGKEPYRMGVPSDARSADYYASLDALLGRQNPWLKEFLYENDGKTFRRRGTGEHWTNLLGLYLAEPSAELLEKIRADCDRWLERNFNAPQSGDPNLVHFINCGLYPYWWYLPELYKITGDKKYLDYAEKGAFFTLSSLWNFPTPPDGEITLYPGNFAPVVGERWWHGRERARLGWPLAEALQKTLSEAQKKALPLRAAVPEKKAGAMRVSRIGVSIEQHSTYVGAKSNIVMPSWSAEMLKVYQHTGRDILMKFSRHSIIGRYANFFGYYTQGFQDLALDPEYPYRGPDITSFYFHHAPCHFAQSVDYLMAQIEVASSDKISFPYVRQQGYAWFTDRVFGRPGKVFYEENCRPLLSKDAVRAESPKVSTLIARGEDSIWAILLNDGAEDIDVKFALDASSKAMRGADTSADIEIYDASGKKLPQTLKFHADKKIFIPAQKLVALRIKAEGLPLENAAALPQDSHMALKNLPEGWGELHAFRIRGPFGKDSLYVLSTDGFKKKNAELCVRFEGAGGGAVSRNFFPYEISVYPVSMDEDVSLSVAISEGGAEVYKSEKLVLKK